MREILEEVEAVVLTQMANFIQNLAMLILFPAGSQVRGVLFPERGPYQAAIGTGAEYCCFMAAASKCEVLLQH